METRTTFEALEIDEAPYVEEYKKKYGEYPVLTPKKPVRLPTRFKTPRGETKFSMGEVYHPGTRFEVVGTEKGKRSAGAVNVVLKWDRKPGNEIVVMPKDVIAKLDIYHDDDSAEDIDTWLSRESEKPNFGSTVEPSVKKIIEERRKGALVSL
jgi:hypothetical protein